MINKIKRYSAFLAAILNVVASAFFANSVIKEWSEPNNISSALGFWCFAASLLLWAMYIVLYFVSPSRKTVK